MKKGMVSGCPRGRPGLGCPFSRAVRRCAGRTLRTRGLAGVATFGPWGSAIYARLPSAVRPASARSREWRGVQP